MGSWGAKPLENDGALDLKDEWEESKNLSVLENALDIILSSEDNSSIDSIDSEAGIAAVSIILDECNNLPSEQLEGLLKKSAAVIGRIIENSELKDLWSETEFFGDWLTNLTDLMQQIVKKLKALAS